MLGPPDQDTQQSQKTNKASTSHHSLTDHNHNQQKGDANEPLLHPWDDQQRRLSGGSASSSSTRGLLDALLECARYISSSGERQQGGGNERAVQLINYLLRSSSPNGDAIDRVIHYFTHSLAALLLAGEREGRLAVDPVVARPSSQEQRMAAYLCLNQVTPFVRFVHLTANQAILEAVDGCRAVHIVDLDIGEGVQWAPLLQALASRVDGPPTSILLSGAGPYLDVLRDTGQRLSTFAASLGLPSFRYRSVHAASICDITLPMLRGQAFSDDAELVVVNCICMQQGFNCGTVDVISSFFSNTIYPLRPKLVIVADREVHYNPSSSIDLIDGVSQAFRHFSALFESLEATLPPSSIQRNGVEQVWLKWEIHQLIQLLASANATAGVSLKWRNILKLQGFSCIPCSAFAVSQARLLLRLHYPSEGYQLREEQECLVLGWQDTPLFAISAWH